jgi:hypothetical protein
MKLLYWVGILYILICVIFTAQKVFSFPFQHTRTSNVSLMISGGSDWFKTMRPYCNPVEVEAYMAKIPPPNTVEGSAYASACFALANKIDRSRVVIVDLKEKDRPKAAEILFEIGKPIADAGDSRSTAPIMRLVLEFNPNNVEALFYAGTSEYSLGEMGRAKTHLSRFVQLYENKDMMSNTAYEMLDRIQ